MSDFKLDVVTNPSADDVAVLGRGLGAFNAAFAPAMTRTPFGLFLRDQAGAIVGGIEAFAYWRSVYVNRVWVAETIRGTGAGAQLMHALEAEAIRRGVAMIWLETMDWQARGFYEKMGYQAFGELEHPEPEPGLGPRRSIFLAKRL